METRPINRVEYVNSLKLSPLDPNFPHLSPSQLDDLLDANTKGAAIDAGSAQSFAAGVTGEHRQAVLNTTLLAQLAANAVANREKEIEKWYAKYHEVLENVGWNIDSFSFHTFDSQKANFTVDSVILDLLAAIASGDDMAIIKEVIDALKKLDKDDSRLRLFSESSISEKLGNFQIAHCSEASGLVTMKLGAFHFQTDRTVVNFFWFHFSSGSTSFYQGAQTVTLNDQIYNSVKTAIEDKLKDNAKKYINNLNI